MHHLPSQHVSQMLRRFTHYRRVISKASFTSVAPHRPRHPWFVDPADEPGPSSQSAHHLDKSHSASPVMQPLPISAPEPLKLLHAELSKLPQLELTKLVVRPPPQIPLGPMLPESIPKGKRRRGKTFSGFGIPNVAGGGTWNWVAMAQVKEGTENRGAIESVVRVVRRTLLAVQPPLPLPPNTKKRRHNGWALIDAGQFAVHVLSSGAWDKYFGHLDH